MSDLVALVTGAGGGIGRALVARLLADGARVAASDVTLPALEGLPGPEERLLRLALDVRDPAGWEAALAAVEARWGTPGALYNVAGFLRPGRVWDLSPADAALHLDVNVKGVILGTRVVGAAMRARGRGHVINVGSLAGLAPIPGLALYSASKFAVRAFSLAAAQELSGSGVAVTVVCPDAVQTPMLDLQVGHEEAALTFSGPRVLSADEVARALAGRVLRRRPLELWLPSSRGWLARAADLFPGAAGLLRGALVRKGLRRQQARRAPGPMEAPPPPG